MKTITERANELASEDVPFGYPITIRGQHLAQACDEWQASVEERLASIGLGLVPAVARETVLASGFMRTSGEPVFVPLMPGIREPQPEPEPESE